VSAKAVPGPPSEAGNEREVVGCGELFEAMAVPVAMLADAGIGALGIRVGKAFLDMLGMFAEFETNLRRERQMEGISAAKARGVYKGRPKSIDAAEVRRLLDEGLGPTAIADRLGIGRASVYRVAKQGDYGEFVNIVLVPSEVRRVAMTVASIRHLGFWRASLPALASVRTSRRSAWRHPRPESRCPSKPTARAALSR
jgi:hypothetical protein